MLQFSLGYIKVALSYVWSDFPLDWAFYTTSNHMHHGRVQGGSGFRIDIQVDRIKSWADINRNCNTFFVKFNTVEPYCFRITKSFMYNVRIKVLCPGIAQDEPHCVPSTSVCELL